MLLQCLQLHVVFNGIVAQDWLYEDGEDQPKSVYVEKYDQLKASAAAIEGRYEDSLTRGAAVEALQKAASAYMSAAQDQV